MAIDTLVDYELAEQIRFYGSLVGTTGVSKEVNEICNKNIIKLLKAMQPSVDKLTAQKAGIITK